MLEQLRKSGASIAIYLIFGLLIIIFVINFAPNAGSGQGGGCMPGGTTRLSVNGAKVNETSFQVAYAANKYSGRQKVYAALEMLIRRELLAQAASEAGLRVTKGVVEEEMKKGTFFYAGFRIPDYAIEPMGGPAFVAEHSFFDVDKDDGETFFNTGKFKGWVNSLNVSVGAYYDEQTRAMQAALMAELISDSVRVSRDEAKADWLFANNTVHYDTVTFSPSAYRDAMRLTDADVTRFLASHEADVKKKYTDEERTYKATKPAYKLRMIKIDIAKAEPKPAAPTTPPTPETPAPVPGTGSGSAAAAAGSGSASPINVVTDPKSGLTVTQGPTVKVDEKKPEAPPAGGPKLPTGDEAKAKLEAARVSIAANKQKFADVAKTLSTDEQTKYNGGLVGWKPVENAGLGDQAINDAVKALKPGEMTAVIVGENAAYLVVAEEKREGDLSFDQVKATLGAEMALEVWSQEAAKRAALAAFEESRKGNAKNLSDMFGKGVNMEEQKRQMEEMIQQQMNQQQGAVETTPAKDIPASWQAGSDQAVPAAGGSAGSGSAAPAAAGSGAGSAAPAAPAPAATPAPAAPVALAPSADVLPQFGEVKKPKAIPYTGIQRQKDMPGLEGVDDASATLFDQLKVGMLGPKVYDTPEGYVLLQLMEKKAPVEADFEKVAETEIARLRAIRGRMAVEAWLKGRCEALAKDGKIKPSDIVNETDDAGQPLPQVYKPCMSFR
ncbi:MAG: SurA N-terminal domain-containing protein [Deltaproteobacteria bacterium]|nr:SurA N-terminal domain-containing protein [Deltaproteobacteria bacterium]